MIRVLLVEDCLSTREIITHWLKDNDFAVKVACDGLEAIKVLKAYSPDIVVLDIVMPRMNGYELCRYLKSDPETKNVPVVMCSSKREEFDRYWGIKQGADAYIVKPFPAPELITTIQELLRPERDKIEKS